MHSVTMSMVDAGFEWRSGLTGLGGRPSRHPAWDEGLSNAGEILAAGSSPETQDSPRPTDKFKARIQG